MSAVTTKLDVRFLLQVEQRQWADDGDLDVYAYPVYVIEEDGQEKIRNFTGSLGDEDEHRALHNLRFSSYYNPTSDTPLWGWSIAYRDVFSVDLAEAERMVKMLRKLHKGFDRLTKQYAYPESYPAFVARFASLLGVSQFGFKASGDGVFMDGNTYRWCDASNLSGYLDYAIRQAAGTR